MSDLHRKPWIRRAGPCAALLLALAGAAHAADVAALLKTADGYRLAAGEAEVQTQIRLLKNGELDKERRYKVLLKPQRRSLVCLLYTSPSPRD